ncbi:hypothetical protein V8C86DRAFT_1137804 [Haematococcus lacustris]
MVFCLVRLTLPFVGSTRFGRCHQPHQADCPRPSSTQWAQGSHLGAQPQHPPPPPSLLLPLLFPSPSIPPPPHRPPHSHHHYHHHHRPPPPAPPHCQRRHGGATSCSLAGRAPLTLSGYCNYCHPVQAPAEVPSHSNILSLSSTVQQRCPDGMRPLCPGRPCREVASLQRGGCITAAEEVSTHCTLGISLNHMAPHVLDPTRQVSPAGSTTTTCSPSRLHKHPRACPQPRQAAMLSASHVTRPSASAPQRCSCCSCWN